MEDRLKKFACIVDQEGFGKAAAEMHISQPALTIAVKKLERELGVRLLDRNSKSISLTPAGKEAYLSAKQLNIHLSNLKQKLAALSSQKPVISLGMVDSMADTLLVEGNDFGDLNKVADVLLAVNTSSQLMASAARGDLQAAIIVKPFSNLPKLLQAKPLGKEPLIIVTHPETGQHYAKLLKQKKLADFLSYNIGSNTQHIIETELKKRSIKAKAVFHSTSPEVILKMVLARQGTAILPYAMVKGLLKTNELFDLSAYSAIIPRPIYLVQRRGYLLASECIKALSSVPAILENLLKEVGKEGA